MRALAIVLVAAFVIALSGVAPVSAQDNATPGIWINPELGLGGPMAPHGNNRSRASADWEVCAEIPNRDDSDFDASLWAAPCLALAYVMELRPYEGELETEAAFLATQHTITRLSPVLFENVNQSSFLDAMLAELLGSPGSHLESWSPNFARESFAEGRPWRHGKQLARWVVWAEGPEERVAGLRFVPKIRLESHNERYSFVVSGVGRWPESDDLVLVVVYSYSYDYGGGRPGEWGPAYNVALLCHDPRLDMFRFMNVEDHGLDLDALRHVPSGVTCRSKAGP